MRALAYDKISRQQSPLKHEPRVGPERSFLAAVPLGFARSCCVEGEGEGEAVGKSCLLQRLYL